MKVNKKGHCGEFNVLLDSIQYSEGNGWEMSYSILSDQCQIFNWLYFHGKINSNHRYC